MDHRAHFSTLARYDAWANRRLVAGLDAFDDATWHADLGLFFKSIHATFNHILLAHRLWSARIEARPSGIASLDASFSADRRELCDLLFAESGTLQRLMERLPDPLPPRIRYTTIEGKPMDMPFAEVLAHPFNHATHHRGQITAAAHRLGSRVQELDMPYFLYEATL